MELTQKDFIEFLNGVFTNNFQRTRIIYLISMGLYFNIVTEKVSEDGETWRETTDDEYDVIINHYFD